MIRFEQEQLDRLIEALQQQPGFITAAVVPAGSGDALIERLQAELGELKLEVAAPGDRPMNLGARAARLGQGTDEHVFVLKLDEPGLFESENQAVGFWRQLNYQREALGSGTVRTCLLLSEEAERGLALIADDLWDWTTIFRFPAATRVTIRTPEDSEALVWSEGDGLSVSSEDDLTILRNQWQRARQARVPPEMLVESYTAPLFLALPRSQVAETIQLWECDLDRGEAVARLPPESRLLVARKMMHLAGSEDYVSHRRELIRTALDAAGSAVSTLERKAAKNPEAFEPGLVAALSTSTKLHQDAGQFEVALSLIEKCLGLLPRVAEAEGGAETIVKIHVARRWALLFLQQAGDSHGLTVLEQIESLRAVQDTELDKDLRSKALGAALEISITNLGHPKQRVNAGLFTAWLLSDDSHLVGPRFEDVLRRDPISYCQGLEALWQLTTRSRWEKLLVKPLIREWSMEGPVCSPVREQLVGWLLHSWDEDAPGDEGDREREDRLRPWTNLQRIAIRVLGYRYEPGLLRVFCRSLASLFELGDSQRHWHHRMVRYLGFMLRWSYQERALQPLQETAKDATSSKAEVEAAKDLASNVWQVRLPEILRRESRPEPVSREESFAEQLARGRRGLLSAFLPEELCEHARPWGVAELAGDPAVPDLSGEDQQALEAWLRALVMTGRVRDDDGQVSGEDRIFDAWIPWLARGSPQAWWQLIAELIERQINLPNPQWALRRFPILGEWEKDPLIAKKIEEKLVAATRSGGKELRENHGLLELLRWALHLEDAEALLGCLEALVNEEDYANICAYKTISCVLKWALDRPTFETAGQRRRAASRETERRLWFLVEWPFVDRLSPAEALAWCREVASLATRTEDLRWMLVDQLVRIDDPGALELLLGEDGPANLKDPETQEKILARSTRRHELDLLKQRYPNFIEGLTLTHRGTFLAHAGHTGELRQWGHDLFAKILKASSGKVPTDRDVVFTWNRRALHRWAHEEPEAFLAAAEKVVAAADVLRPGGLAGPALLEAALIVWQDLDPLTAVEVRAKLGAGSWFEKWLQDEIPVYVHALWDLEFSARPEHRTLRLRWLRSSPSDKDIAQVALAARTHGMLPEVESIAEELLALDQQLERALAISLLAWHPEGDRWLKPLLESDPSAWVRSHAEWAIAVCRRDRLGRQLYREALNAASWLEQQARFEQLIPLVLPTFSLWPVWDQELSALVEALAPRRRALLIDFSYQLGKKIEWRQIVGRDLEKYCRGDSISTHLELGEKGPPWLLARSPLAKSP